MSGKVATFLKDLDRFTGEAKLYRCKPPLDGAEYVTVSAVVVPYGGGPETYIFKADEHGEVQDWGELDGSYKGGLDHEEALSNAGYVVRR